MTFENAVKRIKAKFEEIDASKLADMAVQVTLTDEDCGGTLYFKAADGTVDVQGYDYRDNDAVIDIERKSLMDILSGKTTLDKEIENGHATAKGNFGKLDTLKDAVVKKAVPAKKAVSEKKTTPAKKAASEKKTTPAKKAAPVKKAAAEKKVQTKQITKKAVTESKPTAKTEKKK
jgi:hypothetical protein